MRLFSPTNEDTHLTFSRRTRTHKKPRTSSVFQSLQRELYSSNLHMGGRSPIGGNMSRSSLWRLSVRFSHESPWFHCEKSECIGPRFCSEKSCVLGWQWKWVGEGCVCVCVCLMFFVCLFVCLLFVVLYFVYLFVLYLIQDFCWKQHIIFPSPNT